MTPCEVGPISLYFGSVMHARMKPVEHRFSYKVFSMLVDLDRLEEISNKSAIFGVNKARPLSFHEKDHGHRDGSSLRSFVDDTLALHNLGPAYRTTLLAYPRVFGYTFNPLSVYFCYDKAGFVKAFIYQVHNTFGGAHTYVHKANETDPKGNVFRHQCNKQFYVSPFIEMEMKYHFRIHPPNDRVKLRILETDGEGPLLSATFFGKHRNFNSKNLCLGLLQTAGLTWKVILGIHFEALRLWMKGLKIVPREPPLKRFSSHSKPATWLENGKRTPKNGVESG